MLGIDLKATVAKFFADFFTNLLHNQLTPVVIIIGCLIGLFLLGALVSLGFYIFHSFKKNEDMKKKSMMFFKPAIIAWLILLVALIVLGVIVGIQAATQALPAL